jgi:hypothetical protein
VDAEEGHSRVLEYGIIARSDSPSSHREAVQDSQPDGGLRSGMDASNQIVVSGQPLEELSKEHLDRQRMLNATTLLVEDSSVEVDEGSGLRQQT